MTPVSAWGRLSADLHEVVRLEALDTAANQVAASKKPGIAFGMGRSYGDVALNPGGVLWNATGLGRFIAFDEASGRLTCEAGTLLRDIQRVLVPRGWMLPVTPGTQMITVGGAIANDVHGKNHHVQGTFGEHVPRLRLLRTDGNIIDCGPDVRPDWFAATVGGMGLTGVILDVELQLRRVPGPWLDTETIPYADLDAFFRISDESEASWEQTVSWIDCLSGERGRGIFLRANPAVSQAGAEPRARASTMPVVPPFSLVNRLTLRPFNAAYFALKKMKAGASVAHFEAYSYPLDSLHQWNRLYGPRGFYQYQSVVPRSVGRDATRAMLRAIARSGEGSFLAVLKTFGDRPPAGLLSFARSGVTLALDFPNRGARTSRLFASLDDIVRDAGGCLYPAKDARMPRDMFESGYPQLAAFMKFRDAGISSAMSRRLMGT